MKTIKIKITKPVKNINQSLIDLRNYITSKDIPENENPKKYSILLKKSLTLINNERVKKLKY